MKQFNISYAQEQFKPVHAIVETTDGSDCKDIAIIQWNRTSEILPQQNPNKAHYARTWCLCVTGPFGIQMLGFNHYNQCWENEDNELVCGTDDVTFWAKMPEIPNLDTMKITKKPSGYGNCPDCKWHLQPEGCNTERDSKQCLLNKGPHEST